MNDTVFKADLVTGATHTNVSIPPVFIGISLDMEITTF